MSFITIKLVTFDEDSIQGRFHSFSRTYNLLALEITDPQGYRLINLDYIKALQVIHPKGKEGNNVPKRNIRSYLQLVAKGYDLVNDSKDESLGDKNYERGG